MGIYGDDMIRCKLACYGKIAAEKFGHRTRKISPYLGVAL
jgi:hypothetical protein